MRHWGIGLGIWAVLAAGPSLAADSVRAETIGIASEMQADVERAGADLPAPTGALTSPATETAPPTEPAFAPLDGASVDLDAFLWVARPLIIFADSPEVPAFKEQMGMLAERWPDLAARDVVLLTDTDPKANGPLRKRLHPHGFSLVIIEKDGQIALRKPVPWDVREIGRAIDKMPIRREELRALP
ncbi:DUF4174 domain-containing protein [Phaeovulum sp. W22_SRMD_FR3]|uniref:DUF4174 domain-containing protein n=1 Tax=Phaeovulum sp. W22_SRMD_FR3 TaxID=3240274 RepID=UPI003F988C39